MVTRREPLSVGFAPIAAADARVLILGSLPGRTSLAMQQYYAQPHNAFWKIMGRIFGATQDLPYERRLELLRANRVAVWDVLAAGERVGSLDSAIVHSSAVINDFRGFFAKHSDIRSICFNGGTAAALYRRRVLPGLPMRAAALHTAVLPSTSPAHAARTFAQKLELWSAALESAVARKRSP